MQVLKRGVLRPRAALGNGSSPNSRPIAGIAGKRPLLRSTEFKAVEEKQAEVDDCGENTAAEYCAIDSTGRRRADRTIGEMEAEFIEALSSYYYDGKAKLTVRPQGRQGESTTLHLCGEIAC